MGCDKHKKFGESMGLVEKFLFFREKVVSLWVFMEIKTLAVQQSKFA